MGMSVVITLSWVASEGLRDLGWGWRDSRPQVMGGVRVLPTFRVETGPSQERDIWSRKEPIVPMNPGAGACVCKSCLTLYDSGGTVAHQIGQ